MIALFEGQKVPKVLSFKDGYEGSAEGSGRREKRRGKGRQGTGRGAYGERSSAPGYLYIHIYK